MQGSPLQPPLQQTGERDNDDDDEGRRHAGLGEKGLPLRHHNIRGRGRDIFSATHRARSPITSASTVGPPDQSCVDCSMSPTRRVGTTRRPGRPSMSAHWQTHCSTHGASATSANPQGVLRCGTAQSKQEVRARRSETEEELRQALDATTDPDVRCDVHVQLWTEPGEKITPIRRSTSWTSCVADSCES